MQVLAVAFQAYQLEPISVARLDAHLVVFLIGITVLEVPQVFIDVGEM